MYPNIIIGNVSIPSWYSLLFTGVIISTMLATYARPKNFPLNRKEIFFVALLLLLASLLGARGLFLALHWDSIKFKFLYLFSIHGGFAYLGALLFSIATLFSYSIIKKIKFFALIDYGMPYLLLSQAFVRIGCLFAGCCYGKPTAKPFGLIFKTVDGLARHPTQIYEALGLLLTYLIGRFAYKRKAKEAGFTFAITLGLYGLGRFFVEYLRTDSPTIFLNLTLAQLSCLSLVLIALAIITLRECNLAWFE